MKNCILMMMRWKDLQKFIKNGCNRDPTLVTLKKSLSGLRAIRRILIYTSYFFQTISTETNM